MRTSSHLADGSAVAISEKRRPNDVYAASLLLITTIAAWINLQKAQRVGEQMDLNNFLWVGMFVFAVATILFIVVGGYRDESAFAWTTIVVWGFAAVGFGAIGAPGPATVLVKEDQWLVWGSLIVGAAVLLTGFIYRMRE